MKPPSKPIPQKPLKWTEMSPDQREAAKAKYTWRNGARVRKP